MMNSKILYDPIETYCHKRIREAHLIPDDRKQRLLQLTSYIRQKFDKDESPSMTVICTHNSRRSHLGQIWLAVAAEYLRLPPVQTFSGGTEKTSVNETVIRVLQSIGFRISEVHKTDSNPVYNIRWASNRPAYQAFSKKYDSAPNPPDDFAALMVCGEADSACPTVPGADLRISLPFEDPKLSDGTEKEFSSYLKSSEEICRQMMYVMNNVYDPEPDSFSD